MPGYRFDQWKKGLKDGIPICLGYLAVSFTFGIVAVQQGMSYLQATIMSSTNYTSAGQFAAIGLIVAGAPYLELALAQLVINLRYCLMSAALSQKIRPTVSLPHRLLMAFGITDEIFGVSVLREGLLSPYYVYGLMSAAMPGWTAGTLLGGALRGVLPPRIQSALGIAIYGMFIAVIIPPVRKNKTLRALVLVSMTASALLQFTPILQNISGGFQIILLTLVLSAIAAICFPVKEVNHEP